MNDAFQKAKEKYKKMSKITISGFYDEISGRLSDQICVLRVLYFFSSDQIVERYVEIVANFPQIFNARLAF